MKNWISAKPAGNILLTSFGILIIFHVLVLLGIIPADIIWGGQVGSLPLSLLTLEIIALVVTLLFALAVAAKTGYVKAGKFKPVATIGVWIVFAFLILNTLGNLASGVKAESLIFAPITLILAFCALRVAIEK